MGGYALQVALVLVLVLVNAVFSGSEMALVTLRDSQIKRLERTSARGKVLARLARDPNRFLATIQIGITLAGFLASAAAAVSLAQPLVEPLGFLGSAAEPVAVVAVTMALTFFTLVAGELAPKRVAMQRAEGWALMVARPLDKLSTVSRPVVWLLGKASDLLVRLTGADPHAARDDVSVEEIRDMIAARRDFSTEQRTIISGAFEITERVLREILVPRRNVVVLPAQQPVEDAIRQLIAAGHSRAPVVGLAGLDEVIGVAHLRDLFDHGGLVGGHAKQALFFPETLRVSEALRQMRQQRHQFALVVDEHGAVDGIVTMEDLVEEIVGEIYDETDRDVQAVVHEPDGTILVPGDFPLHDLPDIGVHRDPADDDLDVTTIAGLLLSRLEHIPQAPGETARIGAHTAEVVEVTGHAITKVRLRPSSADAQPATEPPPPRTAPRPQAQG